MPRGRYNQTPKWAREDSEQRIRKALHESPKTFSKLLDATGLARATLSKRLNSLEKDGDIYYKTNDKDRRSKTYIQTPKGLEQLIKSEYLNKLNELFLNFNTLKIEIVSIRGKRIPPTIITTVDEHGKIIKEEPIESHYSATYESKEVEKWRREIYAGFKSLVEQLYPSVEKKHIKNTAVHLTEGFFDYIKLNFDAKLFSNFKLKPVSTSKFKVLSGKVEPDLYAELYQRAFDSFIVLFSYIYNQSGSLANFLDETIGKKLCIISEIDLDQLCPKIIHRMKLFMEPDYLKKWHELEYGSSNHTPPSNEAEK